MTTMGNAYGLIVGIANYRYINRLPLHVRNDAADIYALLTKPDVCGYPKARVRLMLDDDATLAALNQELNNLAQRCDEESTVFIYISSHGGRILTGSDAGEYLLPVDVQLKPNRPTPELESSTALSGEQFTAVLKAIPARKLIVIFDCCHSGGIGEITKAGEPALYEAGLSDQMLERLAAGRGRVILSSSRASEQSYILQGDANSLFTKHLKAGLQGGAPSRAGYIHIFDLFEYIQPRVTAAHPGQHPVLQVKVEENLRIALYLGGQQKAPVEAAEAAEDFRYDAYISWVRAADDIAWMRDRILPLLQQTNLRLAMTGAVSEPGVPAIVGIPRAIEMSKRTLVLLSRAYLENNWANLDTILSQQLSIEEQRARLLPVIIDNSLFDDQRHLNSDVPLSLRMLMPLDLVDPFFGASNLNRLPEVLKSPLPRWKS